MSLYEKIIGHENIINQLMMSVRLNRVSHAYIFNGADGSGKKMMAMAFAEALLCEKQGEKGCNECHTCKQFEAGNNPDFKYIKTPENTATIGIDLIRDEVVADIQIKPYNGLKKVYVIDQAENITVQAQNALLKTIEEPPEYGVIIFLTNSIDTFLPTIVSRCSVYNFKPLRESTITEYLIKKYQIADYDAKIFASFSQGYLGKAIALIESKDFVDIKDNALKFIENIQTYEVYDLIFEIKKITEYKLNINDFIDILEMWFRDVLLFKVTKDPNSLIFKEEINLITKMASKSSYEGIETILNSCEVAKARIKANVNFDLTMELLLLNIKEN